MLHLLHHLQNLQHLLQLEKEHQLHHLHHHQQLVLVMLDNILKQLNLLHLHLQFYHLKLKFLQHLPHLLHLKLLQNLKKLEIHLLLNFLVVDLLEVYYLLHLNYFQEQFLVLVHNFHLLLLLIHLYLQIQVQANFHLFLHPLMQQIQKKNLFLTFEYMNLELLLLYHHLQQLLGKVLLHIH